MTPDRWQQIEQLYHAARTRPLAERAAFLADACGRDQEIRREVESLLDESASDDGFLAESPLPLHLASGHAPAAMVGGTLGGYRIVQLLGVGGMGEVYRGYDAKLERDVAIKILPLAFTRHTDRLARFQREARMLAALNHPNICAIYGLEEQNGTRFLILEFVDGESLADRLSATGALSVDDALAIARQLTDALEAAHERGIVHRDLKPANISITIGGVVKVLDFGLAKSVGGELASPDLSSPPGLDGGRTDGAVIGTAAYMSPEQARGLPVNERTDIWAFGCVLYEMLAGCAPFGGATASDSIAKVLEREPDWSALPVATPAAVRRLLRRCLAKDAKQRLRDIGDARIELDAINEVVASIEPNRTTARRRFALLPWAALLGLAAAFGVREAGRPILAQDPLAGAQFSTLTDWDGTEALGEISPDGRFVAFLADRTGELDLWWSQIGTGDFKNLTEGITSLDTPGFLRAFGFSGDGADIWFGGIGKPNMLMPQSGGAPRPFLASDAKTLAWSSDGQRIAYFALNGEKDPLVLADRAGADARPIAVTPSDPRDWFGVAGVRGHNHNPAWSPDNAWIYFVHGVVRDWNHSSDEMDIWRIRPTGGAPERLTHRETAITSLAVLDDRTLLFTAPAEDGSGSWLWAFDVESKTEHRVVSGLEQFTSISVSRGGARAVATRSNPTANLWAVPLLAREADDRDVRPYLVGTRRALAPRFGHSTLFYLSARGTGDGLWSFTDDRSVEVQKGEDGMLLQPPAPSADGSRVAVIRKRDNRHLLTVMNANGTESRTLAPSLDIYGTADWSPDGKWIVTGGIEGERPGLFKIAVHGPETERALQLADGEAINPVWSPNGDMIVYAGFFTRGQASLFAVRPDGTPVEFAPLRVSPGGYRFLRDGSGLVFLPRPESLDFWLFDFATMQSRQLTRLGHHGIIRRFDVSPDGRHIIFDRVKANSDIVLIDLPKP